VYPNLGREVSSVLYVPWPGGNTYVWNPKKPTRVNIFDFQAVVLFRSHLRHQPQQRAPDGIRAMRTELTCRYRGCQKEELPSGST
jgi:hypothetical protein